MGVLEVLKRTPALAGVDASTLSSLAEVTTLRSLSRRERLWDAGDQPRHFVVVRRGVLKVVRPTAGGRSVICGLFGPPDSVGDLALLKGVVYPAAAIAVTAHVEVALVPRDRILEAMKTSNELAAALVRNAQTKVENLLQRIDVLHSHLFDPITTAAPACLLAGIPHVGTLHDVYVVAEKLNIKE